MASLLSPIRNCYCVTIRQDRGVTAHRYLLLMETRPFGHTGLHVSALGLGCGAVGGLMVRGDEEDQREAIATALDAGITSFDTAPSYGDGASETNLGRVLTELGAHGRVAVGTKVMLQADELRDPSRATRASLEA